MHCLREDGSACKYWAGSPPGKAPERFVCNYKLIYKIVLEQSDEEFDLECILRCIAVSTGHTSSHFRPLIARVDGILSVMERIVNDPLSKELREEMKRELDEKREGEGWKDDPHEEEEEDK